MATALDSIHPASEYAETARRPLEPEQCALVVIDIQEKLLPPIYQKEQLVRNAQLLIRAAGHPEDSSAGQHAIRKGTWSNCSGGRFPSRRNRSDRQDVVFLLWQRRVLQCSQATSRPAQHSFALRHGEPHLRDPDRSGSFTRGISGARRLRRGQFAHGVELEDWSRSHARRGRGHLLHGNDDL